jgi:hypothetical protein
LLVKRPQLFEIILLYLAATDVEISIAFQSSIALSATTPCLSSGHGFASILLLSGHSLLSCCIKQPQFKHRPQYVLERRVAAAVCQNR